MDSRDVFYDVKEALLASDMFCDLFNSDEVAACMYEDVFDCKFILPEDEFLDLMELANGFDKKLHELFLKHESVKAAAVAGDIISMIGELPPKEEVEAFNLDYIVRLHIEDRRILVLGDSHVNFFSGNEALTFVNLGKDIRVCPNVGERPFTAIHFGPCLAYNSCKYGTNNRLLEKTDYLLENCFRNKEKIVVSLGEIDMRVHVFKQVEKQGRPYEQIVDDIIENYLRYLKSLRDKGYEVYCWGPIASQKDKYEDNHTFLPRNGSEQERNRATGYFTKRMSELCINEGITFMSIFGEMIDNDYFTKEELISSDHWHLGVNAWQTAMEIWKNAGLFD